MRLRKDERICRLLLESLPVVLYGLDGNSGKLRLVGEQLLERIKLLVREGWKNDEAIITAAIGSTQNILEQMLTKVERDDIPFAIDALRNIE